MAECGEIYETSSVKIMLSTRPQALTIPQFHHEISFLEEGRANHSLMWDTI